MVSLFLLLVVHVGVPWFALLWSLNDLTHSLLSSASPRCSCLTLILLGWISNHPFPGSGFFFPFSFFLLTFISSTLQNSGPVRTHFAFLQGAPFSSPIVLQMLSAQIRISSSNPMTLRLHLPCLATPNVFITPVLFLKIRSRVTWRRAC